MVKCDRLGALAIVGASPIHKDLDAASTSARHDASSDGLPKEGVPNLRALSQHSAAFELDVLVVEVSQR